MSAGTSAHADGSRKALANAMAAPQTEFPLTPTLHMNGNYDPTDIYNSNAYDYNALQALGHCCNPNSNPGSSSRNRPLPSLHLAISMGLILWASKLSILTSPTTTTPFLLMGRCRAAIRSRHWTLNGLQPHPIVLAPSQTTPPSKSARCTKSANFPIIPPSP